MSRGISVSSFVTENAGTVALCNANLTCKKKIRKSFCGLNKGRIDKSFDTIEGKRKEEYYPLSEKIEYMEIATKEQYCDILQKVNAQEKEYIYQNYELKNDIDMNGMVIQPFGKQENSAFQGIFNGNGYKIYNFIIEDKEAEYIGFFGYLKNAKVINLSIDGFVKGKKNVGGFAGLIQESFIHSCNVKVTLQGKAAIAGFAVKNTGEVANCYASGSIKSTSMVPLVCGGTAVVISACVLAAVLFHKEDPGNKYFPPVPIDTGAVLYDDTEHAAGNHKIDCGFTSLIKANTEDGVAKLNFKNPGESNQHMVIQIQITDEELIKASGENGRTKEQQQALEADNNYNPKTMRVIVGESGTIPPGYKLDQVQLKELPNGKKLKAGEYNAIVYLTFYDIYTNQKAMINTQTPVKLIVV